MSRRNDANFLQHATSGLWKVSGQIMFRDKPRQWGHDIRQHILFTWNGF